MLSGGGKLAGASGARVRLAAGVWAQMRQAPFLFQMERTFVHFAANGSSEPKSTDAATSSNGRDEHGADVLGCDHSPCRLLKRVKYTHAYAT